MYLNVGDKAPRFSVTDVRGRAVNLKDFAGKHLLLCFYRYAGCPFCNLSLKELVAFVNKRRKNDLAVVAFFQSPRESVLAQPGKLSPPFPLVADPTRSVYDRYGIGTSYMGAIRSISKTLRWVRANNEGFPQGPIDGSFYLMPAQFLVSPSQNIELAHYWNTFGDETPFAEIEAILKKRRP